MGDPISRHGFIRWGATGLGVAATSPLFGGEAGVTQTMVQVAALAMPELKVEIKCIARF